MLTAADVALRSVYWPWLVELDGGCRLYYSTDHDPGPGGSGCSPGRARWDRGPTGDACTWTPRGGGRPRPPAWSTTRSPGCGGCSTSRRTETGRRRCSPP